MNDHANGPRHDPNFDVTRSPADKTGPATVIGAYRLLEKLGEGGMGEVWLAEQAHPVRRQVALKVIKSGMHTAEVVGRFEAERQALALMEHPNIAKVFEGGSTVDGRPYFAMEYVRGEPIHEYCDRVKMPLKQRLDLFAALCDGVQHAHQKGIIHRDLKPSNILVTLVGDQPVPRIIDFGIAKAIAQPLTSRPLHTELGTFIGTPEYMSPEQAEMTPVDVDTRSDVYSLGMILYQLLTGSLPFDTTQLRGASAVDIRRTIREQEPPRPSTRVRMQGDEARTHAAQRSTQAAKLMTTLRGDLDWITLKAIEKDRTRRYDSASALAADIRRYLRNEPVSAGLPSATYRARKFVRRHRLAVAMAASLVLLAVVSALAMAVQAQRVAEERDRARAAQAKAEEVSAFLVRMFQAVDPSESRGDSITARELLDRGVARIDELQSQPEVQAQLMDVVGRVYQSLGVFERARLLIERGLATRRTALGDAHADVGTSLAHLGEVLDLEGKYEAAEAALRQALAIHDATVGRESVAAASDLHYLAAVLVNRGDAAQARPLFEESLAIRRRLLPADDPEIAESLSGLAYTASSLGNYEEMEARYRDALAILQRAFGGRHPRIALGMNNLAAALDNRGRYADAEQMHRQALAMRREIFGADHPAVATSLNNLSNVLQKQEKYSEAESMIRQVVDLRRRLLGPDHPSTATALNNLGVLLFRSGKPVEAEPVLREARQAVGARLGEDHPFALSLDTTIATVLASHGGRDAEAEALFRRTHAARLKTLAPDHPDIASGLFSYGRFLSARRRFAEAEPMLREALAIRTKALGREHPETKRVADELAALLKATNRAEEAVSVARGERSAR